MLFIILTLPLFVFWIYDQFFAIRHISKHIKQELQVTSIVISRGYSYLITIIRQSAFALIAFMIALFSGIPVFGSIHVAIGIYLLALSFLALFILTVDPLDVKYAPIETRQWLLNFVPQTTKERLVWIAFSLVVAMGEEIVYRAVFFGIFYQWTESYWGAAVISAILFGISYRHMGVTGIGSRFVIALGLQYFVRISGGLYIPIAIHFLHDFLIGIFYGMIAIEKHRGRN